MVESPAPSDPHTISTSVLREACRSSAIGSQRNRYHLKARLLGNATADEGSTVRPPLTVLKTRYRAFHRPRLLRQRRSMLSAPLHAAKLTAHTLSPTSVLSLSTGLRSFHKLRTSARNGGANGGSLPVAARHATFPSQVANLPRAFGTDTNAAPPCCLAAKALPAPECKCALVLRPNPEHSARPHAIRPPTKLPLLCERGVEGNCGWLCNPVRIARTSPIRKGLVAERFVAHSKIEEFRVKGSSRTINWV